MRVGTQVAKLADFGCAGGADEELAAPGTPGFAPRWPSRTLFFYQHQPNSSRQKHETCLSLEMQLVLRFCPALVSIAYTLEVHPDAARNLNLPPRQFDAHGQVHGKPSTKTRFSELSAHSSSVVLLSLEVSMLRTTNKE